jgi:hypothetical protein
MDAVKALRDVSGSKKEPSRVQAFVTLKTLGVDTLTDQERGVRRLPIQAIQTKEALFQPRHLEYEAAKSGRHLEELKRALAVSGELDPIVVLKAGGKWWCVDGHHRLEAYVQSGNNRRTHIPVKVFIGSLEEAFAFSVHANAPDKLNLTKEDKLEAAWSMVLLGSFSARQISDASMIAERTVQNMRGALQRATKLYPSAVIENWMWKDVKQLLRGELREYNEAWKDAKAKEIAKQLARHFHGMPAQHPRLFAKALRLYDRTTALDIAQAILAEHQADAIKAEFPFPDDDQDF